MQKKYLLEGESIISQSSDNSVYLTNFRLRYLSSDRARAQVTSIMLEKISSIEIHYKSNLFLLILGLVGIAGGLVGGANNEGDAMVIGVAGGVILVLFYFITRRHEISVKSDGGISINFQIKGMKSEAVHDFINLIEKAKRENYSTKLGT